MGKNTMIIGGVYGPTVNHIASLILEIIAKHFPNRTYRWPDWDFGDMNDIRDMFFERFKIESSGLFGTDMLYLSRHKSETKADGDLIMYVKSDIKFKEMFEEISDIPKVFVKKCA